MDIAVAVAVAVAAPYEGEVAVVEADVVAAAGAAVVAGAAVAVPAAAVAVAVPAPPDEGIFAVGEAVGAAAVGEAVVVPAVVVVAAAVTDPMFPVYRFLVVHIVSFLTHAKYQSEADRAAVAVLHSKEIAPARFLVTSKEEYEYDAVADRCPAEVPDTEFPEILPIVPVNPHSAARLAMLLPSRVIATFVIPDDVQVIRVVHRRWAKALADSHQSVCCRRWMANEM